ncbi:uncharacterized protein K452DRAFT_292900 [Aplosporella prunicola CBS 121167]|uniref:Uncharacterized protein n=1 Tax=Aplosporella prunicola CBS 121167 TaxID=1176127 RepID=A0A6A6AXD5_9PEZI|nr:uncharacterized protein K452DRAFT_292900 [Aplosporella prunicola CBS 121167]KAF2135843.1 hypothetical protein K452DRAFT_292900 [Aplosporella prunicola CBS 121167]
MVALPVSLACLTRLLLCIYVDGFVGSVGGCRALSLVLSFCRSVVSLWVVWLFGWLVGGVGNTSSFVRSFVCRLVLAVSSVSIGVGVGAGFSQC